MSDLHRAVEAELDAHRPDTVPPFSVVRARKRRRGQRRITVAVLLSVVAVAGVAVGSSTLIRGTAANGTPGYSAPSPSPSPPTVSAAPGCDVVMDTLLDVITVGGAATAEGAADRLVEATAQRDPRYTGPSDGWAELPNGGSTTERRLRGGTVQITVAQGPNGTWHAAGLTLCAPNPRVAPTAAPSGQDIASERTDFRLAYTGPVLIDGGGPDPQAEPTTAMSACLNLPGVENVVEGVKLPLNYRLDVAGTAETRGFRTCAEAIEGWQVVDTSEELTLIVRPDNVVDIKRYASRMTTCLNLPGVRAGAISETPPLSYAAYAAGKQASDLERCLRDVAGAGVEEQPGAPGSRVGLQEFIERCVGKDQAGRAPDQDYVGLTEDQVDTASPDRTQAPRIVGRDRVCLGRDDDRQENRVNIILDDYRVVWAGRF